MSQPTLSCVSMPSLFPQRRKSVRSHRQQGVALITSLLILLLISTMIAGLAWLVMTDQKLGGNNNDRQLAFYGAEAGMEQLSASLENLFDANYAPDQTAINNLMTNPGPPTNIPNVQYIAAGSSTNGSGYSIIFPPDPAHPNLPKNQWSSIPSGTYAGLYGLMTPYTLTVTARTAYGSEVKLQRQVQTVGIPVFQFGFFSQTDLSFFAAPPFNFGGRVHTNGNLWLGEVAGNTLTLPAKVTAAGEIITANLVNGYLASTAGLGGPINIYNGSGTSNLLSQSPTQSVTGTTVNSNYFQHISAYKSTFAAMAASVYQNNIGVKETGVSPLNVAIATPAIGGQSIDLIRRPVPNEDTANSAKYTERYYSQVSLRILLSDYGPSHTCTDSDISSAAPSASRLPALSAGTPIDLATLAWDTDTTVAPAANGNTTLPYSSAPAWLTGIGTNTFPLPVSYAAATNTYASANGYWVKRGYPIITGCIKIDYQNNGAPGTWTDVTAEILKFGYTGRNINPQGSSTVPPALPALPGAQIGASGPTAHAGVTQVCTTDPSPNAVIRLARVRDNPSFWANTNATTRCGVWPTTTSNQYGTDYWPNVLWDTREGSLRDTMPTGAPLTLAGAMYYVELDVANLDKWFTNTAPLAGSGGNVLNTTGYSVYFSDRRGNMPDPNPPPSVGGANVLTGGFGYEDFVNSLTATAGCPDGVLNAGEDLEGDYNSSGVDTAPILRTYGATPQFDNAGSPQVSTIATLNVAGVLNNHPSCAGPGTSWPFARVDFPQELRENPSLLFRRALKLVHGDTLSLGACSGHSCGLAVIAENPVYVQGCYNNPGQCGMSSVSWSGTSVGASVIGDAVTLLSDKWNDVNSFAFPYGIGGVITGGGRDAITTTHRMAVAAGKGVPFQDPAGGPWDLGTDGGAHNFLRYLEDWTGQTGYYDGSIVSLFYNHQATGIFKCCTIVYEPPTRTYQFDTNFQTQGGLPPLTPMLRTINTIGFTQVLQPTQ